MARFVLRSFAMVVQPIKYSLKIKHHYLEKRFPTHLPLKDNSLFLREEVITAPQTFNMELKAIFLSTTSRLTHLLHSGVCFIILPFKIMFLIFFFLTFCQ